MVTVSSSRVSPKKKKVKKPARPSFDLDAELMSDDDVNEAVRMMMVGMEGVGKSSFAAHAPRPVFLCGADDHGIHTLRRTKSVPKDIKIFRDLTSFDDTCEVLESLADPDNDHDRQTVVVDTLSVVQQLACVQCCDERFNGDWGKTGFLNFFQGPHVVATDEAYWPRFITACSNLTQTGMNVILMAHSVVKKYENPDGPNYDRYTTDLYEKIWKATAKWCDVVLFMKPAVDVQQEKHERAKGTGGDQRLIHTEWSSICDAKNRYGLDAVMGPYGSAKDAWDDVWKGIQDALNPPEPKAKPTKKLVSRK